MALRALTAAAILLALSFAAVAAGAAESAPTRPNLLYIVVDDLRPQLGGVYNASGMITPAFERLQAAGTTFTRAFANVAVCSPSRTSFLTGMRPAATRVWTIGPYFRAQAARADAIVTLSQALKAGGWNATGAGKVWHPGTSSGGALSPNVGGDDMPASWSYGAGADAFNAYWECDQFINGSFQSPASVAWPGGAGCVQTAECVACLSAHGAYGANVSASWVAPPCADSCFPDGAVADRGVAELTWKAAHGGGAPWALFLGMKRPHLSFFGPAWAYAMYDNATAPLSAHRLPPAGMPQAAFFQNGEIAGSADVKPAMYTYTDPDTGAHFNLVHDWKQHELRWAYRSVVTYMDAQVGRVLDALEATGLRNSTWVVAHGDHGWSLGERGEWAKQNLFDEGTRVPLIIVPPSGAAGAGYAVNASFDGIVELLDVFPTLAEVLGLPGGIVPPGQLAGDSLAGPLRAPPPAAVAGGGGAELLQQQQQQQQQQPRAHDPAHTTAFSEIARGDNVSPTQPPADGSLHGLSVRTPDWRFAAWLPFNYSSSAPLWGQWNASADTELYDMRGVGAGGWEDYDNMELVNVAHDPAHASVVAQLTAVLQAAWPGAAGTAS